MTPYYYQVNYYGNPQSKDVGIEVEVEGVDLPATELSKWNVTEDGSLRGGLEYITDGSLSIHEVSKELNALYKRLNTAKLSKDQSYCSIHVHVNCQARKVHEVLSAVLVWYLLEDALIDRFCGDLRKSNCFCMPVSECSGVLTSMKNHLGYNPLLRITKNECKYMALNLSTLSNFGTLEFRPMEFSEDVDRVIEWVHMCYNIVDNAHKLGNPSEIMDKFYEHGFDYIVEKTIGLKYVGELDASSIEDHSSHLLPFAYLKDWDEYYRSLIREFGEPKERKMKQKKKKAPNLEDLQAAAERMDAGPVVTLDGGLVWGRVEDLELE